MPSDSDSESTFSGFHARDDRLGRLTPSSHAESIGSRLSNRFNKVTKKAKKLFGRKNTIAPVDDLSPLPSSPEHTPPPARSLKRKPAVSKPPTEDAPAPQPIPPSEPIHQPVDSEDDVPLIELLPRRLTVKPKKKQQAGGTVYLWTVPKDGYTFDRSWLPAFSETPGCRVDTVDFKPVDYFKLFFDDFIWGLLSTQTNLYHEQRDTAKMKKFSRYQSWTDTTKKDIMKYIGLTILMGVKRLPAVPDYWSRLWLFSSSSFRSIMSSKRFDQITGNLHFTNNEEALPKDDPDYDRIWKIRPVLTHIQQRFKTVYYPERDIAIDESFIYFQIFCSE